MIASKELSKNRYNDLVILVGNLLEKARKNVYSQINRVLVITYWEIGKRIVEFDQGGKERANYGAGLLGKLSEDLINRYGKGFSRDNLEKMRNLYLAFGNSETLSRKLSWSHYCLILRLDSRLARSFYIKESEKEGWSVRELDRQIRIALSKDQGAFELSRGCCSILSQVAAGLSRGRRLSI